jgi:hypothetical protein
MFDVCCGGSGVFPYVDRLDRLDGADATHEEPVAAWRYTPLPASFISLEILKARGTAAINAHRGAK